MRIYLSNQGNLRNIQTFLRSIDWSDEAKLEIATHDKWITVHPANLALTAALAIKVGKSSAEIKSIALPLTRYAPKIGWLDLGVMRGAISTLSEGFLHLSRVHIRVLLPGQLLQLTHNVFS